MFSTYLGGSAEEVPYAIAIDDAGAIWVAGRSESQDFPLERPLHWQPDASSPVNGFVARLSSDGRRLLFSTYLGGSSYDVAFGVAPVAGGRAWIAGATIPVDFPIVRPIEGSVMTDTERQHFLHSSTRRPRT